MMIHDPESAPRVSEPEDEEPSIEGAFAPDGVDLTVIRWMLKRTPTQRLQAVQDLIDTTWALRVGDET
jgi:hypothetical protein